MVPELPCVISPILRIEPVPHDHEALISADGFVFTSVHAIPAAGPGRGRLALCVGERTGETARQAGFDVRVGNGFAEGLLPLIEAATIPLIHPHGRHVAKRLPVPNMVVYEQIALPLQENARELLGRDQPVILPVFSPRSAELLAKEVQNAMAPIWLVAISRAAMAGFHGPVTKAIIAKEPTSQAMVKEIRDISRSEQS